MAFCAIPAFRFACLRRILDCLRFLSQYYHSLWLDSSQKYHRIVFLKGGSINWVDRRGSRQLPSNLYTSLSDHRLRFPLKMVSADQQNLNLNSPILTISSPDHNHLFIHNSHRIKHHYSRWSCYVNVIPGRSSHGVLLLFICDFTS